MRTIHLAPLLILAACWPDPASAQCILANPSFEIGASGAQVFGGWNQFGPVSSSSVADHGAVSARIEGPQVAGWGTSGVWQRLDTAGGERWEIQLRVRQDGSVPLTGASVAMVNVEWRDAAENLISYDSYSALTAGGPTDVWQDFSVVSNPAPTGAVSVRLLLGVLEAAGEPAPVVLYDRPSIFSQTLPTIDSQQWADFPGGRTVRFAGYDWRVKGDGYYGPGPGSFEDDPGHVWVDALGELHLTVRSANQTWMYTEVALSTALGYGDYVFTTRGDLDAFDPRTVLGLFLWQYGPCWDDSYLWWNPFNEIDIEFSRWGDPASPVGYFTAQPYDWPGNQSSFDAAFGPNELSSHAFRWSPDRVEWRSWRGGAASESPATTLHTFTYTGPHLPRPEQPRVHMNLWSIFGPPATTQEAVIADFRFTPLQGSTVVSTGGTPTAMAAPGRLLPAVPNPFNPRTRLRFELDRAAVVTLDVFDVAGRRVRSLLVGSRDAGVHSTTWDGLDDAGREMASGVYLFRLSSADFIETRKGALVR